MSVCEAGVLHGLAHGWLRSYSLNPSDRRRIAESAITGASGSDSHPRTLPDARASKGPSPPPSFGPPPAARQGPREYWERSVRSRRGHPLNRRPAARLPRRVFPLLTVSPPALRCKRQAVCVVRAREQFGDNRTEQGSQQTAFTGDLRQRRRASERRSFGRKRYGRLGCVQVNETVQPFCTTSGCSRPNSERPVNPTVSLAGVEGHVAPGGGNCSPCDRASLRERHTQRRRQQAEDLHRCFERRHRRVARHRAWDRCVSRRMMSQPAG